MPKIDQFESVFRAASREPYSFEQIAVSTVLVVTDMESPEEADEFSGRVRTFLRGVLGEDVTFSSMTAADYRDIGALIDRVEREAPDLVCAYRNLKSTAWQWPYSLGSYISVLTQATKPPLLLVPHPKGELDAWNAMQDTSSVMVVADHLTGDHRLVNYGVRFTQDRGSLHLTHVESRGDFDLYMDAISKIPNIDTDLAREEIERVLLKDPADYIRSCREIVLAQEIDITIKDTVLMGHRVDTYEKLIHEHDADLLVVNTKHTHQLAMDSLAHRLGVEFRQISILML